MTLKIGTVQADITANTTGLKQAEAEVIKSTKNMDAKLQDTERAAMGASKAFKKTGKAANDTGKAFNSMGSRAGRASIQVQQMVGQLQGGVSPFIAISQQAADFGIVMGAPLIGVIVSLSAVLAGVLHKALTGSAEAMQRSSTSAADLSKEYLKLTGQTKELAIVNLQADMLRDAEAILVVGKELSNLKKRKDELIRQGTQGIFLAPGLIQGFDREISKVDNRFQLLISQNETRAKMIRELFTDITGGQEALEAPEGGAVGGQDFNALVGQEIAALQLRAKLFNDSDAAIEAEIMRFQLAALNLFEQGSEDFLAAEQALQDKRIELRQAADDKILEQNKRATQQLEAQQRTAQSRALVGMQQLGNQINEVIEKAGKEGTAIAKALFIANKAIQVAQIIASTQVGAAQALALGPAGIPIAALIEATGFASAGIVAGLSVGEAFANGGIVGGSSFSGDNVPARVNSGEMILNKGQQANLFALANNGGSGGQANVTIISNGTPQEVTGTQVSRDEIAVMINDAGKRTEGRINASLSTGRGDTAASLQKGFKAERNIR